MRYPAAAPTPPIGPSQTALRTARPRAAEGARRGMRPGLQGAFKTAQRPPKNPGPRAARLNGFYTYICLPPQTTGLSEECVYITCYCYLRYRLVARSAGAERRRPCAEGTAAAEPRATPKAPHAPRRPRRRRRTPPSRGIWGFRVWVRGWFWVGIAGWFAVFLRRCEAFHNA